MFLKIGRTEHLVHTVEEARAVYNHARDEANEGASTFPNGILLEGNTKIGTISYNGRAWKLDGSEY